MTAVLRELGIGLVPYSPLGRGFLTAAVDMRSLSGDDFRKTIPRLAGENLEHNTQFVEIVREVAATHGVTPAQIALAWVLSAAHDRRPLPDDGAVGWMSAVRGFDTPSAAARGARTGGLERP